MDLFFAHNYCNAVFILVLRNSCDKLENSKEVVRELDIIYKRKWLETHDYFVNPCTVTLGNHVVQQPGNGVLLCFRRGELSTCFFR